MKEKKQTKIRITESQLITSIIQYCNYAHIFCYKSKTVGIYNTKEKKFYKDWYITKGIPDLTIIINGYYLGIECKVGKNKQSPDQIEFERKIKSSGGGYMVVYSLDEFVKTITTILKYANEKGKN